MTRVKRGSVARRRRKKILKVAKGFNGAHSSLFRTSKQQVLKSLKYSYVGRKRKKREFRKLWISRISASVREHDVKYCSFIASLKKAKISLNRKILAQIAVVDPSAFYKLISIVS